MQINFNPNLNCSKPNFKASFANDASTKKVLENFIRNETETTLATQFALEDIKTNDKISLRYDAKTGDCYAKNMTTTNEILLEDRQLSNPSKLYRAIVEEGFLNERLEGKKNYYLDKAIEFIKKQFSKEQEELNKLNYEYEKLLSDAEFESLKTKLENKLCADKDFPKENIAYILERTNEQNIALAEKLCADKDFPKKRIGFILKRTNEQNIALAEKLCADKDFPKEQIGFILESTNEQNIALAEKLCADKDFPKYSIGYLLEKTNEQNIALAEKLCADKDFPKEWIGYILEKTNEQNLESKLKIYDLMKKDKDFPKENIADILRSTNKQNLESKLKIYDLMKKDKDFPKEQIANILWRTNEQNIALAKKLCADKDSPIDLIANILKKTSPENIKLCTELCDTKDFPVETIPDFINSVNKETEEVIRDMCYKEDFPKDEIGNICKSLRCINNESNVELLKQALVTRDLSPSVIAKLLDSSFIKDTGDDAGANQGHIDATKVSKFTSLLQNSKIAPYIVKLLNDGVDMDTASFLAKTKQSVYQNKQTNTSPYLPKNHNYTDSQIEFANTLGQLDMNRGEIDALIKFASVNGEIDPQILGFTVLLLKNGFPPNMILSEIKSLWADETPRKVETKTPVKNIAGTRSRESVTGLERKLIDQYNPEPEIWRSEIETRKWAEEKYQSKKALEYISTYKAIDDPEKGLKVSQQRKETLAQWYEFLETDETARDNPFVKLIVIDAITRDLLPENTTLAPEFDKTIVKKILADAMNDSHNISLAKSYKNAIKAKNTAGNKGETIEVNGVKGTWFTVPQTDSSSPDFSFNVAKVKAYSDGTNWCIRSWNAGPYIQQGDMHFFVDEKGLTQVCIRENAPGVIAEIQQRQQNEELPIPYIEVIDSYITSHKLNADNFRRDIDVALSKKPNFDKLKQEIQELYTSKNYKAIFEEMGIQVTVLEDGTWKLSHYMIDLEGFTLNDLGINENDLLSNVSQIAGNANFANSNATSIPRLRHVGGKFDFIGSKISDVRSLEEINGYKISWE